MAMVNLNTCFRSPLATDASRIKRKLTMSDNMLGNALALVAGPMKDFFTKLAGSDGMMWLAAFNRFLRKENPWSKFAVRFVVTLGLHKLPDAYKQAIEA
ncbi:MAG: hypothetical protein AAB664_03225, partial [Patescibacteria group bacterium]